MSAEPIGREDRDPTNVWLDQFKDQHKVLLRRAREAAETTGTPGWQTNFKVQRALHERAESDAIASILRDVESIKLTGTHEDVEKSIKDSVKVLSEERVRYRAWEARAVENYRKSAVELQSFIEGITRRARDKEQNQPLIDRGFEGDVKVLLGSWHTATWDEDTGAVLMSN